MKDDRIRITYVIHASEIGGTEKMLLLLLKYLDMAIFAPTMVLTTRGAGRFTEELKRNRINVRTVNIRRDPFAILKIIIILKREEPHILHSFLFCGNILARLLGRLLNIRVVISSQRSVDNWRRWYHWKIDSITSRWADIIISNSVSASNSLVERRVVRPSKIAVVSNGLEATRCEPPPKLRSDCGIAEGARIVGAVGNLRRAKGHKHLISAAPLVLKRFPDAVFMIVGEGELRGYLIDQAESLGIGGNFVFTGYRSDVLSLMSMFDVYVMPSEWEGFPVSLMEAMSLGKACVASPAGDIPHIIQDGLNGFIVVPEETQSLADIIIKLLENSKLRKEVGLNARMAIKEKFSAGKMVKGYENIYLKLFGYKND